MRTRLESRRKARPLREVQDSILGSQEILTMLRINLQPVESVRSVNRNGVERPANTERTQRPISAVLCEVEKFPRRFASKVKIDSAGCWNWIGAKAGAPKFPQHAYGRYWPTIKPLFCQIAHRFAYEFIHGPIPKGLEIDHTCQNKLCVNPAHLELVTHQENCKRRPRSGPLPKKRSA